MLADCLAYGLDMLKYGLTCHNEIQIDCTCKNTDKLDMLKKMLNYRLDMLRCAQRLVIKIDDMSR